MSGSEFMLNDGSGCGSESERGRSCGITFIWWKK